MSYAPTRTQALAWTAFEAFNKGAFLIYAGQESGATHRPSLFEIDKVEWGDYELAPFLTRLAMLKKHPALVDGQFTILESHPAIQAAWQHPGESLYGIFNVSGGEGEIDVQLPDGTYEDVLHETEIEVRGGWIALSESAVILRYTEDVALEQLYAPLLDY